MTLLSPEFRALSAKLGKNRLRVQGAGGNTSIKSDDRMWIKASGTQLADAEDQQIFVEVDLNAARAQAKGAGDGSCKDTTIDPACSLRPSIETTFHAALNWPVVAHTHSILALAHGVSAQGRIALHDKLEGLDFTSVPYRKPGRDLTYQIMDQVQPGTNVIVLENHGLICCGRTPRETQTLMEEVEARLTLAPQNMQVQPSQTAPMGFDWMPEVGKLAADPGVFKACLAGSYYPDHVVFLGQAMTNSFDDHTRPAILVQGQGVALRKGATAAQRAMLQCLSDMFAHLQPGWKPEAIGIDAEAELLNWDAEKYRQALARKPA